MIMKLNDSLYNRIIHFRFVNDMYYETGIKQTDQTRIKMIAITKMIKILGQFIRDLTGLVNFINRSVITNDIVVLFVDVSSLGT